MDYPCILSEGKEKDTKGGGSRSDEEEKKKIGALAKDRAPGKDQEVPRNTKYITNIKSLKTG